MVWNVARGIVSARMGGAKGASRVRALAAGHATGRIWAAAEASPGAVEYDSVAETTLRALDSKKLPHAHRLLVTAGGAAPDSPDAAAAVCFAAGTSSVTVIDISTGAVVGTLAGHSLPITGIALSDDEVRFFDSL